MPARRTPSYLSSPWNPRTISAAMPTSTAMSVVLLICSTAAGWQELRVAGRGHRVVVEAVGGHVDHLPLSQTTSSTQRLEGLLLCRAGLVDLALGQQVGRVRDTARPAGSTGPRLGMKP